MADVDNESFRPTLTFKASDGIKLKYFDVGKKGDDVVLLVHGFSVSTKMFDLSQKSLLHTTPIIPGLLEKGFRVIAMDLRGHGLSDKPHGVSNYGLQVVKDQVDLMDHLNIDKFHIAGWSMGAELSIKVTVEYPDRVKSLFLYASGWSYGVEWDSLFYRVVTPCSSWYGCLWALAQCCWYPCCCCCVCGELFGEPRNDLTALSDVCRGMDDVLKVEEHQVQAIDVPVIAIVGDQDEEYRFIRRMEGKVKDFNITVIPDKGHLDACEDPIHHQTFMEFYNH